MKNLNSNTVWKFAAFLASNTGYIFLGKILSYCLLAIITIFFWESFNSFARISVSGSLIANLMLLGLPYTLQLVAEDTGVPNYELLMKAVIIKIGMTLIFVNGFDNSVSLLMAITISMLTPLIMSQAVMVKDKRKSYLIHFFMLGITQPVIYICTVLLPFSININNNFIYLCIIASILMLSCRFFIQLGSLRKIYVLHSFTVLFGSIVSVYFLSGSVLSDDSISGPFLWLLIQIANVFVFLTNNLSYRLIRYFGQQECKDKYYNLAIYIYLISIIVLIMLSLLLRIDPLFAIPVYTCFLLVQGSARVSGSFVLALRSPYIPLLSSLFTFAASWVYVKIFPVQNNFEYGVSLVLFASMVGAVVMVLALYFKKRKCENKS